MPPHLAQDPALSTCPNFTSEGFCLFHDSYSATNNISPKEAIAALTNAWKLDNEVQRAAWALQVEENERMRAEELWVRNLEVDQRQRQEEAEAEAERIAVEKKKPKMNDFDDEKLVGNTIITNPSQYALNKLTGFHWVELWYFSPDAHNEAALNAHSTSNNVYSFKKTDNAISL